MLLAIFVFRITYSLFLLNQEWEGSSPVTLFLIQLEKKKKKKKEEEEEDISSPFHLKLNIS
jgi:hypothetical protein